MPGTVEVNKSVFCRLHYKKIRVSLNLPLLTETFSSLEHPAILGGNAAKKEADGFSYWAACPKEIFELNTGQKDAFGKLQHALSKYKLEEDRDYALPEGVFCGGWIGYFSYELGRCIERLPETTLDDLAMPLIRLCFYDRLICYDHSEEVCWLIVLEISDDDERPADKLAALERLLAESRKASVPQPAAAELEKIDLSRFRCNMDKDYYLEAIKKIKRYIYNGDVYQINFSQRFESDYIAGSTALFHWQNHYNPSGYSAYIDAGDFQIVSASPEMFLLISNGLISTKPIKGTRPRTKRCVEDEKNFNELLVSEKEKAELNMIIDLERNDLARVCKPGTRTVIQQRTIESYPTVFHAVATVQGELREGTCFCDILKAMFPGGSITGAPKVSSMEIIDETEPTARGVYTGSIGFLSIDGNACLNIAIRTIIIKNRRAYAQTGGGIVADSDAEAEWAETITKALALLVGINSVGRSVH
ncbi:MAG: anthranilate synthase component I family protein [Planctomycetota bacterium]|jgi:para-aminobenzoate synthetase component 1